MALANLSLADVVAIVPTRPVGCVRWKHSYNIYGYPQLTLGSKRCHRVNRVICTAVNGPAPTPRHHAAHDCGHRWCYNPAHIVWKTPAENMADKVRHGTHSRGERHPMAKLTSVQVVELRRLRLEDGLTYSALGELFGITPRSAHRVATGISWAHEGGGS